MTWSRITLNLISFVCSDTPKTSSSFSSSNTANSLLPVYLSPSSWSKFSPEFPYFSSYHSCLSLIITPSEGPFLNIWLVFWYPIITSFHFISFTFLNTIWCFHFTHYLFIVSPHLNVYTLRVEALSILFRVFVPAPKLVPSTGRS